MKFTKISVSDRTKNAIKKMGQKGKTYDQILTEITSHCEACDRFWEDRFE